jgi:hypothetical protein
VTGSDRARRIEEAGAAAARRADEARARIDEIEERLEALRSHLVDPGSSQWLGQADYAAARALEHGVESLHRAMLAHRAAVEIHAAAARAHDAAASAHDQSAAIGVGDVERHHQRSRLHREQAAADRVAEGTERDRLHLIYPQAG